MTKPEASEPLRGRTMGKVVTLLGALTFATFANGEQAPDMRIAVAANFRAPLVALLENFNKQSDVRVHVSAGSTGALYAQIGKGAPFDVFMAADRKRPALLQRQSRIVKGSRFTYAIGRLVLWIPGAHGVSATHLQEADFPIAIANPRHAPYGQAAMQVLGALGRDDIVTVMGTNVAQAANMVATGNARGGFVALAHMVALDIPATQYWLVPNTLHGPIEQQVVALTGAPPAHRAFLDFLQSDEARQIIATWGYDTPGVTP